MNIFQQKQVTRALEKIPTKPLTEFETEFINSIKRNRWELETELSEKQNKVLNRIMNKFQ